jgi:hypothetical protein
MIKKPAVFQPTLLEPQGINNYSGKTFRCFTKGDTLPFRFTFKDGDGLPLPGADAYDVYVEIANELAETPVTDQTQTAVVATMTCVDAVNMIFEGSVTDTQTLSLKAGMAYATAKYVTDIGVTHIIDMAMLEVYPGTSFTVL